MAASFVWLDLIFLTGLGPSTRTTLTGSYLYTRLDPVPGEIMLLLQILIGRLIEKFAGSEGSPSGHGFG